MEALKDFFKLEAAGGIVLVLAAILAVIVANSPAMPIYQAFLDLRLEIRVGALEIDKPLILWINDGLMAIFFFLVGLEIKREFMRGQLSTPAQAALPAIAAVGGMIVPAIIYVLINFGDPENLKGWAIPAATDIAFALGVLALLGSRAPLSLKILLTAIAIFDDLGAIIIIAIFYTDQLSFNSLLLGAGVLAVLGGLNLIGVRRLAIYVVLGIVLWVCVLKSGVHATLAGVALAIAIPLKGDEDSEHPLFERLEHGLHNWVSFGVLPIFAFANAGVSFSGISLESFVEPVKLGVSLGLFLGKQIGIFGSILLAVYLGIARLPHGANWMQVYGIAALCGIGFTMSLFIGGLAWEHSGFAAPVRLGVITGSLASALVGALVILLAPSGRKEDQPSAPSSSATSAH